MPTQLPICPSTTICDEVCDKLKEHGLNITTSTVIGRNLLFNGPIKIYPQTTLIRAQIDAYTVIHENVSVITSSIGRYCTIGHAVEMGLGQHDVYTLTSSGAFQFNASFIHDYPTLRKLSFNQRRKLEETNEATIGHDVWIGPHSYIVGDVTIGTGAVIETGSVITHDVPPYAIVSGAGGGTNSHGIIKGYRFSDEEISDLLELKWWEYDLPKLMAEQQNASHKMPFEKVKDFLSLMRNSDLSTWPKLEEQWLYLMPLSSQQVQMIPASADFDMGHLVPESYRNDPNWL